MTFVLGARNGLTVTITNQ